jgi:hypothetical protein
MDRRKAIKMMASTTLLGGAGYLGLSNLFKPEPIISKSPTKIEFDPKKIKWEYSSLNPQATSQSAYDSYKEGSCMYGVFNGIVSQLSKNIGEPWMSFPTHMMKYGHGGIGGTGTICGSLNGASALIGLIIEDKKIRDALIASLFNWYENTEFPSFEPQKAIYEFTPPTAMPKSVLCHASCTSWCNKNGYTIASNERKERCRRLTADVAAKTVEMLNMYFDNSFIANTNPNEANNNCMTCHSPKGKVGNVSTKMNCSSCHEQTFGHKAFGDIHYKYMDKR